MRLSFRRVPLVIFVISVMGVLLAEAVLAEAADGDPSIEKKAKACRQRLQKQWGRERISKNRIQYLKDLKRKCGYSALGDDRFKLYFKTCKSYVLQLYSIEKVSREKFKRQVARCRHLAENYQSAPTRYANRKFENCKVSTCVREEKHLRCKKSGEEVANVGVLFCRVVYAPYVCMRKITEKVPVVRWQAGKAQGQIDCADFAN